MIHDQKSVACSTKPGCNKQSVPETSQWQNRQSGINRQRSGWDQTNTGEGNKQ